jgi:hypothetical protein
MLSRQDQTVYNRLDSSIKARLVPSGDSLNALFRDNRTSYTGGINPVRQMAYRQ